jgi:hypothetical protein
MWVSSVSDSSLGLAAACLPAWGARLIDLRRAEGDALSSAFVPAACAVLSFDSLGMKGARDVSVPRAGVVRSLRYFAVLWWCA